MTRYEELYKKHPTLMEAHALVLEVTEEVSKYLNPLYKADKNTTWEENVKKLAKKIGWSVKKLKTFLDSEPEKMTIMDIAKVFYALGRQAKVTSKKSQMDQLSVD